MYLFQRCEDGFILREFQGFRGYPKDNYREQKTSCWEVRRVIYDHNAIPVSAYYWGDYKHSEMRWIKTAVCSAHWWGNAEGKVYGRTLPNLAKKELKKTGLIETIKSLKTFAFAKRYGVTLCPACKCIYIAGGSGYQYILIAPLLPVSVTCH